MIGGESLIQRLLSSDTKADLLTLFRGNPGLVDGIDGVARRIGRRPMSIKAEVDDLLDGGVRDERANGAEKVAQESCWAQTGDIEEHLGEAQ